LRGVFTVGSALHLIAHRSDGLCRGDKLREPPLNRRTSISLGCGMREGVTMAQYLLGLDHGTGGVKGCIIDDAANVLSYAYREYPIYSNLPGWSEHDPHLYWTAACDVIRECISIAGIRPEELKGIANSSALPSMVMVDEQQNPIHLAYNLMDRRATEQVQWLRAHIGEERLFAVSRNRLEDHPALVNLMWERQNRPESFARIHKALTIDGYIRLKLTGRATANYSSGAFFGVAYDITRNSFNQDLMREIGLDRELLPEFFPCEEIIGYTLPGVAESAGLVPGIPVAAGSVDCNAGWVGGGAVVPGDIQINLGTCGVIGVIHEDRELILDTMINCSYVTDSRRVFATVAATTCGGQSLRYLRDTFSQLEVATEKVVPGFSAYESMEKQAESVPLGCEGLIVLPYLMGERTPLWDVNARGVIFGLSLNHSKAHLVRATMEGVTFAMYDSFRIIQQRSAKINLPIVLNEGGARNRLWRRIITDVFNVPTVFLRSRVGAPMGDAVLAGVAVGLFKDFTIAREKAEYVDPMDPIVEHHERYMEYYALYGSLYSNLKGSFGELSRIRAGNSPKASDAI
jgi:sugar (pentulose or hexulose) kinase